MSFVFSSFCFPMQLFITLSVSWPASFIDCTYHTTLCHWLKNSANIWWKILRRFQSRRRIFISWSHLWVGTSSVLGSLPLLIHDFKFSSSTNTSPYASSYSRSYSSTYKSSYPRFYSSSCSSTYHEKLFSFFTNSIYFCIIDFTFVLVLDQFFLFSPSFLNAIRLFWIKWGHQKI